MPLKSKKSPAKRKPKLNIIRQLLQEKERKKEESPPGPFRSDHRSHHAPHRHEQFAKFAGPRRRAA